MNTITPVQARDPSRTHAHIELTGELRRCSCGVIHAGGSLHFDCFGVAACPACNWRGVATIVNGRSVTYCPACEAEPYVLGEPRRVEKVGRNAPCPCGSGAKYKKCCGR